MEHPIKVDDLGLTPFTARFSVNFWAIWPHETHASSAAAVLVLAQEETGSIHSLKTNRLWW